MPINADAPDTYVKCYLRDSNEHLRQKKKTDVVRHDSNPKYNQVIKYSVFNISFFFLINYITLKFFYDISDERGL